MESTHGKSMLSGHPSSSFLVEGWGRGGVAAFFLVLLLWGDGGL